LPCSLSLVRIWGEKASLADCASAVRARQAKVAHRGAREATRSWCDEGKKSATTRKKLLDIIAFPAR